MKLLVIVDAQNDFIDGALGTEEAKAAVPNIVNRLKNMDKTDTLVLFTKDTHDKEGYQYTLEAKYLPIEHCIKETPGWSLNKEITSIIDHGYNYIKFSSKDIVNSRILKNTFGSDRLRSFLIANGSELEEIEFMGFCTDICVISNVLMARQTLPNTEIYVDASCCAGSTPEKHKAALEVMKSCQINII